MEYKENALCTFYEKPGFKLIPHDYCGYGMRKVVCK